MIKRIKSLISVKNLTASQFADLLGVQRSNISHILSGRNKPSLDFVLKITEHFPLVSIEWLLKGKGEMFNLEDKTLESSPSQFDLQPKDSALDKEKEEELIKTKEDAVPVIAEGAVVADSSVESEDAHANELVSIAVNEEGIEQIMVLYKNGSFRVYTPQK